MAGRPRSPPSSPYYYSSSPLCARLLAVVVSTLCVVLLVGTAGAEDCECTVQMLCSTATVEEEVPNGTRVGHVTDIFGNSSDPSQSEFVIFDPNPSPFAIDDLEGEITVAGRIDRERDGDCIMVQILATKTGGTQRIGNLLVQIEDINDNAPAFLASNFTKEIPESPAGIDVLCDPDFPVASDPDASSNGKVSYTVIGGDASYFTVTNETCLRTVTEVDRETTTSLFIVIRAEDNGSPSKSSEADIFVTVTDQCDNTPTFVEDENPLILPIPENEPNNSVVHTFMADDPDEGANGEVHYSIRESQSVPFWIESDSGKLRLMGNLDWELGTRVYSFTVEAVDGCQSPSTGVIEVSVQVQDVNEPALITYTPNKREFNITENTYQSGSLLEITIDDSDSSDNQGSSVEITSGGQYFQFSTFLSFVFVMQREGFELDREGQSEVDLNIMITQEGKPLLYHWINVTINVLDVNDNVPELNETHFKIAENANPFEKFAELGSVAFDLDEGLNGTVTMYELIAVFTYPDEVNLTDEFLAENGASSLGILVIPRALDREGDGEYLNISVRLTDGGGRSVVRNIVLEVLDRNDERPHFSQVSYEYTLLENQPPTIVGNVTATDNDNGENGTVIYSLEEPSDVFAINNRTGEITSLQDLDRENTDRYELLVTAQDMGAEPLSASSPVTVIVVIGDEDDNVPSIDPDTLTSYIVQENAGVGYEVGEIEATDEDIDENAVVHYRFEPDSDLPFAIGELTGIISVSESLEGQLGQYNITVIAYNDPSGSPSDPSKLNITITVVVADEESTSNSAIQIGIGVGIAFVLIIVIVAAVITCLFCWANQRKKRRVKFSSGDPMAMNNKAKPLKSSIKLPSSGEQSGGAPSRRVQFEQKVHRLYYDTKPADTGEGLYKVESDLLAISDGESPQTLPRHTNGTIIPSEGHSNGVPPQYYPQGMPPHVLRKVTNAAELELSESTTDEPTNFDGNSDEESTFSDDNASNINAQITRFEERVPSLSTAMRFPNPIPHSPYYQHTPSPPHPIPPLPSHAHYDPHHHSDPLTLTPVQNHSLSSHTATPPIRQISSVSPSHLHSHRHRHPHSPSALTHSPVSLSHTENYPSVMPGALSVGEGSPPRLSSSLLMQPQPYTSSFVSDFDSCTYESSDLDEELKFPPDIKPEFISLTATDVYSYDEETDQL